MTEDKNKRQPPPKIEILNPRYKGATPEMVARALLKNSRKKLFSQVWFPNDCTRKRLSAVPRAKKAV